MIRCISLLLLLTSQKSNSFFDATTESLSPNSNIAFSREGDFFAFPADVALCSCTGPRPGLADSGSTGMYLAPQNAKYLHLVIPSLSPTHIRTASDHIVTSSHTARLCRPSKPDSTTLGHVVPAFSRSLISIPVLADANIKTIFTRRGVVVT